MRFAFFAFALFASTVTATANVNVMASIKPVHSLVAQVMQGVGTPGLIVDGSGSPHTYTLKPAQAAQLEQADVIFWVGHDLEAFLEKPIESLGSKATSVSLIEADGVKTLPPREGTDFADDDHEHNHGTEVDAHIWLDPENAKAMTKAIAAALSKADEKNAAIYTANAKKTLAGLDKLSPEIAGKISSAKNGQFIVFHDAYHYFERRFGIEAAGAISINPEKPPGAKALSDIRARLAAKKVGCVFSEPQFDSKLVDVVIEGSNVKKAVLDPLGADLEPGPALYAQLLTNLAQNLADCLRN
jgi:zinc transport system substrate-binding protein